MLVVHLSWCYSQQQIQQAMKPETRTKKTEEKEEKSVSTAYLPYTQTTYGKRSRMLAKYKIKASPYHPGKYPATYRLQRTQQD